MKWRSPFIKSDAWIFIQRRWRKKKAAMLVLGVEGQKERTHVIVSLGLGLVYNTLTLHRLHLPLSLPFHLVLTNHPQSHKLYVTGLLWIEYMCVVPLDPHPLMIEQYPRHRKWRERYRWRSRRRYWILQHVYCCWRNNKHHK